MRGIAFGLLVVLALAVGGCGTPEASLSVPDGPPTGSLLVLETQPCNWLQAPDPDRCDSVKLVRLGLDGQPIEEIDHVPPMGMNSMALSADRSRIAWTWNWEVGVMGVDGSEARVVTEKLMAETMGERAFDPAFSPDGSELLYRWVGANQDARWYRVDLGSGDLSEVDMPVDCQATAWAPDGHRVACEVEQRSGDHSWFDLVLVDLETMDVTPLTEPDDGIGAFRPEWSPDGRWLALTIGPGNEDPPPDTAGLWLLEVETGKRERVAAGRISVPTWSPDGSYLAAYDEDEGRIIIVGRDGSGLVMLDHEPRRYVAPRWITGE